MISAIIYDYFFVQTSFIIIPLNARKHSYLETIGTSFQQLKHTNHKMPVPVSHVKEKNNDESLIYFLFLLLFLLTLSVHPR